MFLGGRLRFWIWMQTGSFTGDFLRKIDSKQGHQGRIRERFFRLECSMQTGELMGCKCTNSWISIFIRLFHSQYHRGMTAEEEFFSHLKWIQKTYRIFVMVWDSLSKACPVRSEGTLSSRQQWNPGRFESYITFSRSTIKYDKLTIIVKVHLRKTSESIYINVSNYIRSTCILFLEGQ